MKKFHWAVALATSVLVASPSAFASSYTHDDLLAPEDNTTLFDHDPNSIYAGVGVGYLSSSGRSRGLVCTDGDCDSTVWKGYLGYQFTDSVAGEVAYHSLGHYEDTNSNGNSDASGYSATATIKTGLMEEMNVFGRVGFMVWNAPVEYLPSSATDTSATSTILDNSGTDLIIGGGADYRINNNLSVRGEYEHVGGDLNAHIFSVGAKYSTL